MKYSSDMKDIREHVLAKSVLYNIVLAVFITLALAVVCVYAFGLRLDVVLSDSMVPVFKTDDIIVVKQYDDYKIGDIIEYNQSGMKDSITHRVVAKTGSGKTAVYETLGDNSTETTPTPVSASQINGKVISIFEDGNLTYQFIKSNYFLFIDIILGIWVLASVLSGEKEIRSHNIAKV